MRWLGLALVSAFGIFGCVQFIRGKSAKVLMLALTLGVVVDVIGLVAVPLIQPMLEDQEQIVKSTSNRTTSMNPTSRSNRLKNGSTPRESSSASWSSSSTPCCRFT